MSSIIRGSIGGQTKTAQTASLYYIPSMSPTGSISSSCITSSQLNNDIWLSTKIANMPNDSGSNRYNQKNIRKKLQTNQPVSLFVFGDGITTFNPVSFTDYQRIQLLNYIPNKGYSTFFDGTFFYHGFTGTGGKDGIWASSYPFLSGSSGSSGLITMEPNTDTHKLYYVAGPGVPDFKIEFTTDGIIYYPISSSVSGSAPFITGSVTAWSFTSSISGDIKVTLFNTGTLNIPNMASYRSLSRPTGFIWGGIQNQGGFTLHDLNRVSRSIWVPILQDIKPDLIISSFISWFNSPSDVSTDCDQFCSDLATFLPNTDVVLASQYPFIGDATNGSINTALTNSLARGFGHFDGRSFFESTNNFYNRGFSIASDNGHPTPSGDIAMGKALWSWLDLFNSGPITSSFAISANTASFLSAGTYQITSSQAVTSSFASGYPKELITGSTYQVTASWASNSISSSFAVTVVTASYASGYTKELTTGSTYPITSSQTVSSSFTLSSSFASSYPRELITGSTYPITSSRAVSSSYSVTSSFALNAGGSSGTTLTTGSTYPITSSWSNNSITSSVLYNTNASINSTGEATFGTSNSKIRLNVKGNNQIQLTGTMTDTNGDGTQIDGNGTLFLSEVAVGDIVTDGSIFGSVLSITNDVLMAVSQETDWGDSTCFVQKPSVKVTTSSDNDNPNATAFVINATGQVSLGAAPYRDSSQQFPLQIFNNVAGGSAWTQLALINNADYVTGFNLISKGITGGIPVWGIYRYGSTNNNYFAIGVNGGSEPFTIRSTAGAGANQIALGALIVGGSNYQYDFNRGAPSNGAIIQGNVGIGTNAPSTSLHVIGSISSSVSVVSPSFIGTASFTTNADTASKNPYIQVGSASLSTATSANILFKKAFPNTNYIIGLSANSTITNPSWSNKTVTGFTASFSIFTGILDWSAVDVNIQN